MSQNVSLADVERYNPADDAWETVAPLSAPRRSIAVTSHGGRLYVIGGSGKLHVHVGIMEKSLNVMG